MKNNEDVSNFIEILEKQSQRIDNIEQLLKLLLVNNVLNDIERLLLFHDLISGRAVLLHLMCDLQPVFPVFFIVGGKVTGIKDVQQKMDGPDCLPVR